MSDLIDELEVEIELGGRCGKIRLLRAVAALRLHAVQVCARDVTRDVAAAEARVLEALDPGIDAADSGGKPIEILVDQFVAPISAATCSSVRPFAISSSRVGMSMP